MQNQQKEKKPSLLQQVSAPWPEWARRVTMYLGGQWVSMLGSAVVQFAIMWHVQRVTNSGAMMAIGSACGLLPQALISPIAGVWADRYNRKKLILFADSGIAVVTLVMAVLFMTGNTSVWWLFALSAVRGLGAGIQAPAVGALLPQLVPEEHLLRVNGANGSAQSFIMLIPPVISAWVMSVMPLAYVFFLDVVTAAIGISLLLMVKVPRHVGQDNANPIHPWHELREGLQYVWRTRTVRVMLGFYALITFLIVPIATLSPLMVQRTFGMELWRLTAVEVAFSAGAMVGGAVIAMWGGWKNRTQTIVIATVVMGLLTAAFGLPIHFAIFCALMLAVGFWVPFYNAPGITLLQENTDPAYMARTFSLVQMVSTLCFPIGMMIFGPLGDAFSIKIQFVFTGLAITAVGLWMMRSKVMIEAGKPRVYPAAETPEGEGSAC